jgi:hypothetical protein
MYVNGFAYDASPTTFGLASRYECRHRVISDDCLGERSASTKEEPIQEGEDQLQPRQGIRVEDERGLRRSWRVDARYVRGIEGFEGFYSLTRPYWVRWLEAMPIERVQLKRRGLKGREGRSELQ